MLKNSQIFVKILTSEVNGSYMFTANKQMKGKEIQKLWKI